METADTVELLQTVGDLKDQCIRLQLDIILNQILENFDALGESASRLECRWLCNITELSQPPHNILPKLCPEGDQCSVCDSGCLSIEQIYQS